MSADSYEVVINRGSKLESADVDFQPKTPTGEQTMTIIDISKLPSHQNVSVPLIYT